MMNKALLILSIAFNFNCNAQQKQWSSLEDQFVHCEESLLESRVHNMLLKENQYKLAYSIFEQFESFLVQNNLLESINQKGFEKLVLSLDSLTNGKDIIERFNLFMGFETFYLFHGQRFTFSKGKSKFFGGIG